MRGLLPSKDRIPWIWGGGWVPTAEAQEKLLAGCSNSLSLSSVHTELPIRSEMPGLRARSCPGAQLPAGLPHLLVLLQ